MRILTLLALLTAGAAATAPAQIKTLRPGWNLFSPQQDIQLGKEAASQVQQKLPVVHNRELQSYLDTVLDRLKQSPHAGKLTGTGFPFTISPVYDKNINAFALPGGPLFVHTALIEACDNEAQLAGVIGHEMSHIVLRHSTNQVSKRNLVQIPAILAGAVLGNGILGQLGQIGLGLGANSVLLKFSRTDEAEADYNGALIAAEAGYNPLEMAHFFEKLEAKSGRQGYVSQLLSDHPNPGNRVQAVEDEIRHMPQHSFNAGTGQFPHIKDLVAHLQPAGASVNSFHDGHPGSAPPTERPSARLREFRGASFTLSYPDNWQVFGDQQGNMVTIAPAAGVLQSQTGVAIGYGAELSYFFPPGGKLDLDRDTKALIGQLTQQNEGMRVTAPPQPAQVGGHGGLITRLASRSPYQGETESDTLVTVPRPEGLFYIVFIVPESEMGQIQGVLQQMVDSVRFKD